MTLPIESIRSPTCQCGENPDPTYVAPDFTDPVQERPTPPHRRQPVLQEDGHQRRPTSRCSAPPVPSAPLGPTPGSQLPLQRTSPNFECERHPPRCTEITDCPTIHPGEAKVRHGGGFMTRHAENRVSDAPLSDGTEFIALTDPPRWTTGQNRPVDTRRRTHRRERPRRHRRSPAYLTVTRSVGTLVRRPPFTISGEVNGHHMFTRVCGRWRVGAYTYPEMPSFDAPVSAGRGRFLPP